jgi:8-amino-7-oxononanoate synthase
VVPHLALASIEEALRQNEGVRPLGVVVESYFSMDGDGPDLSGIRAACDRHGAFLFVDEAHALGVYGPEGGGRCRETGIVPDAVVGGLGKAVGGHGGFVAGSDALRRFLWNKARSFVFSTATSPWLSERLLLQLSEVRGADSARRRLLDSCETLRGRLRSASLQLIPGSFGPIVSVVLGDNNRALQVAQRLAEVGVRVQAIRPPTVHVGSARIRVSLKSWFTDPEIDFIAEAVIAACRS